MVPRRDHGALAVVDQVHIGKCCHEISMAVDKIINLSLADLVHTLDISLVLALAIDYVLAPGAVCVWGISFAIIVVSMSLVVLASWHNHPWH